jgi:tetratricopeptide (TPR) repeat protein
MKKTEVITLLSFFILQALLLPAGAEAQIGGAEISGFLSSRYQDKKGEEDITEQIQKAQKLSYEPGHLADAIAAYRKAVDMDGSHWEARLGLARVLSWAGRNAEAMTLYDALIDERPDNADALLGRARIARWTGACRTAEKLLRHAMHTNPIDYRLLAEKAQLNIAMKRFQSARKTIDLCREVSPDAFETKEAIKAYHEATESCFHVKTTMSEESTHFRRLTQIIRHEAHSIPGLKMQFEALYTHFSEHGDELERISVGVGMKKYLPWGLSADLQYRDNRVFDITPTNEVAFQVGGCPFYGPIETRIGVRRRALVDLPAGYKDIAYLEGISSGGATLESIKERLQIGEVYVEGALAPCSFLYVYGHGNWGEVDDDNTRRSIAAGAGLNITDLFGIRSMHTLTLKFDYYDLSFQEEKQEYYSPDSLHIYTPGIAWRMAPSRRTIIGFEGGRSRSEDDKTGYVAEGYFRLSITNHVLLDCRMKISDDTVYKIKSGAVGFSFID